MKINKNKLLTISAYGMLFFISFVFFVYITFPYQVLKEFISTQVFKYSGVNLRIEDLRPSLPLGVKLKNIKMNIGTTDDVLNIPRIQIKLGLLSLLIGNFNFKLHMIEEKGGSVDIQIVHSLLQILNGKMSFPSVCKFNLKKFNIENLVSFILNIVVKQVNNPLLGPFLSQINIKGALNGKGVLNFNSSNIAKSYGDISISVIDGRFQINDVNLNIAEQKFNKALIKAVLKQGVLKIDNNSGLQSNELGINLSGELSLKPVILNSNVKVDIDLWLDGELKNQFGFIIDALTGSVGARANIKLLGSLGQIRAVM